MKIGSRETLSEWVLCCAFLLSDSEPIFGGRIDTQLILVVGGLKNELIGLHRLVDFVNIIYKNNIYNFDCTVYRVFILVSSLFIYM